jgi:hypothetical protein
MAFTPTSGALYSDSYSPNGASNQASFAQSAASVNVNDPSTARLATAGLGAGGTNPLSAIAGKVFNFWYDQTNGSGLAPEADWRVRLSMQPATASLFYANPNNKIMNPLVQTSGLIFPYTPALTIRHSANYNPTKLTHSNYSSYFYEGSEVSGIDINAEFTVQDIAEGQYLMAAIHFMRACTKMFFGQSQLAGTPPPMVFLDGYGSFYLPHVPCVVTSFSHTMPAEVDYINVPIGTSLSDVAGNAVNTASNLGPSVRLPTTSTFNISLQPVYSRTNIANNFTLENYSIGALVQPSVGSRGGFL